MLGSIEVGRVVKSHIEKCREIKALQYALAVIIPEANGTGQLDIVRALNNEHYVENKMFMTEDSSGRGRGRQRDLPGSVTTHRKKLEMVHILSHDYLKRGLIGFAHGFVVAERESCRVPDVQLEIVKHTRNFRKQRIYTTDAEGAPQCEVIFTGKKTGDKNDDFIMALLLAVYNRQIFFESDAYSHYWHVDQAAR